MISGITIWKMVKGLGAVPGATACVTAFVAFLSLLPHFGCYAAAIGASFGAAAGAAIGLWVDSRWRITRRLNVITYEEDLHDIEDQLRSHKIGFSDAVEMAVASRIGNSNGERAKRLPRWFWYASEVVPLIAEFFQEDQKQQRQEWWALLEKLDRMASQEGVGWFRRTMFSSGSARRIAERFASETTKAKAEAVTA